MRFEQSCGDRLVTMASLVSRIKSDQVYQGLGLWTIYSVYFCVAYAAMGDEFETVNEFTKWVTIYRAAGSSLLLCAYWKWCDQVTLKYKQKVKRSLVLAVALVLQTLLEFILMVGSIWLFWTKAVIVRIAFGSYSPAIVLLGNFVLHYLSFLVLALLVFTKARHVRVLLDHAHQAAHKHTMGAFCFGFISLLVSIYLVFINMNNTYGVGLNLEVYFIPSLIVLLFISLITVSVYFKLCSIHT